MHNSTLSKIILDQNKKNIDVYNTDLARITRDAYAEEIGKTGGYSYRQVIELVQNAADAIGEGGTENGKIVVKHRGDYLYVANTGSPITEGGILALMGAFISTKRGNQIGQFGIGFKSLLKVSSKILFASEIATFEFDSDKCREAIQKDVPSALGKIDSFPSFSQAFPVDFDEVKTNDPCS